MLPGPKQARHEGNLGLRQGAECRREQYTLPNNSGWIHEVKTRDLNEQPAMDY